MLTHVKLLGVLHIVFGALGILLALALLFLFGGLAGLVQSSDRSSDSFVGAGFLGLIGVIVFFALLIFSLPGLIAGIGIVNLRPWGRILGIVISALDLLNVPLGTAVGVYGLWVLLSNQTEALFRNPAAYLASGPAGPPAPYA
jgi:hypothetical protein